MLRTAPEKSKPLRYPAGEAARLLGIDIRTLWMYGVAGKLTPIHPSGKGRGKPTFYMREEIELFAAGDLFGVEDWQRKFRARLAKSKPR